MFKFLFCRWDVRTDEHTCSKFLFYSGNDYRGPEGLPAFIDEAYIPEFLDGPCKVDAMLLLFAYFEIYL